MNWGQAPQQRGSPKRASGGWPACSGLLRLSERQLESIQPFFPRSRGVSRVDESKMLSGSIHVLRSGLLAGAGGCTAR